MLSALTEDQLHDILTTELISDETDISMIKRVNAALKAKTPQQSEFDVAAKWQDFVSDYVGTQPLYDSTEESVANQMSTPTSPRKLRAPMYKRAMQTAASFLLIVSVLFGLSMLNADAHATFAEFVKALFSDHTEYSYEGDISDEIPKTLELKYIPDGYKLLDEKYDSLGAVAFYQSEENQILSIEILDDTEKVHVDNEHKNFYSMELGDYSADVYESNSEKHPSTLLCIDENRKLILIATAYLSIDELTKIIENIE